MNRPPLTIRQLHALMVIVRVYDLEERGVRLAEIADGLSVSTTRAHELVGVLRDRGMVAPARAHSRYGAVPTRAGSHRVRTSKVTISP
jgi:DNA-binding IclR family transcriptional regulator